MPGLTNLGYIVIGASNLDAWQGFATDIVGFQVGARTDDLLTLRMDNHAHRFILERGPEDDVKASGWLLDTIEDLDAYVERLRSCNMEVHRGDDALVESRKVGALYYVDGPNGVRHEFFANPWLARDQDPFTSKVLQSKFVTGRLGLGHYIEVAKDYQKSYDYLKNTMSVNLSGFMRSTEMGGANVAFFHADTGRFHSIATVQFPFPKKCFHIGLEIADFNDVGRAFDRALQAGIVEQNFGYHPNAKTTSFYFRTPSGFWMEMGYGEVVIDDADWHIETHQETSGWGHKPYPKHG